MLRPKITLTHARKEYPLMIYRDVGEAPFTVYELYHYRQEPVFRRLPLSVVKQANEGVRRQRQG